MYAWDKNNEIRAKVLKDFQDRLAWIVDEHAITHSGFKVISGPLLVNEILALLN